MWMGILGICGRMGEKFFQFYKDSFSIIGIDKKKHTTAKTYASIDDVEEELDVLIDFSSPSCKPLLYQAMNKKIPVLSGTTGYEFNEIEELENFAKKHDTIFYWSANYAKGIQLFKKLIEECNQEFEVFDFVEIHAITKKDAPSGTAKMLAKLIGVSDTKIQSLRLHQAPAIHELIFTSEDERVIVRHEVLRTSAFIVGFDDQLREILGGKFKEC